MDRSDDKTVISMPAHDVEQGNWLSKGYVLQGRYIIEAQLGAGGFGITYLAKHRYLEDIWVAIKEYLPDGAAVRDSSSRVRVVSERYNKMYSWGLHRFLDEARLLRQFNHPNIVSVQDFFEANNTAYLVMNYIRGRSLQAELDGGRVFDEEKLRSIIYPLLDALQCIHREGLYHRDISPDNILLKEDDDTPVLIDFGSARYAMRMHGTEQIEGGQGHTPTAIFKQGYSPIEQYEATDQGPFTDIYALGATLYRAALGTRPNDALKRSGELRLKKIDPLEPASEKGRGRFSAEFLKAIDAALHLDADDRPQTIDAWLDIFGKPSRAEAETKIVRPASSKPFWRGPKVLASLIAILIGAGIFAYLGRYTIDDIPALLSTADKELAAAPFSNGALVSAGDHYLQVLKLEQENARALSGYNATTNLKQFVNALEEKDLAEAEAFLNKAETHLRRAGIDTDALTPGRQRLQLHSIEAKLKRVFTGQPLSAGSWSDIGLLLKELAGLPDGEALAAAGTKALEALKAAVSAVQKQDFDSARQQIEEAESQLSALDIDKLRNARTRIEAAQRNWQVARETQINALLTAAEQHLRDSPLTPQSLQKARQIYQSALDLDSEQAKARAGLSICDRLLETLRMAELGDFANADETLSAARQIAGSKHDPWNRALQQAQEQLVNAKQIQQLAGTRETTRTLLEQATENLSAAPFDPKTLSEAGRLLQKAHTLSRETPQLVAETEAAAAGINLVALLNTGRKRFDSADFDAARSMVESEEMRTLSYELGLGRPFLEKARNSVSLVEITWNLSRAETSLSENLWDSLAQDRARQHLQRVRELDTGHATAAAALTAIDSLHHVAAARENQDFDSAVAALRKARPPLLALGVSETRFQAATASIGEQQQGWVVQRREEAIEARLGEAIDLLRQQPFDNAAWQDAESLFEQVAKIDDGGERAGWGLDMLAALKSAENAATAGRFGEAAEDITLAEQILANIGGGRFEQARRLLSNAEHEWASRKRARIAESLAFAERILAGKDPSAAVLQQTHDAYQTVLELDANQKQAQAGLAVTTSLEVFLQALQDHDFDRAAQSLAEATATARAARLAPGLLKGAEARLSSERDSWNTNQAAERIMVLLQRASEELNRDYPLDQRLAEAEKALQEAVVLSQGQQGLEAYAMQSNAGLEGIILLRAFKGELENKQYDAANETLSDARQRLADANIDTSVLDKLSNAVEAAEIDWRLAEVARSLGAGDELLDGGVGLDKAEKNLSAVKALDPERAEIDPALQGIVALRQMTIARAQRDYERARSQLEQAAASLSGVGVSDRFFEAIGQRLDRERQHWTRFSQQRYLDTWTAQAIGALNRSPFDETTWQTVASLVEKITSASADDQRGSAVSNALDNMRQVKQAVDEQRLADARSHFDQAHSALSSIGVRQPLTNAYSQLQLVFDKALQTQRAQAAAALQAYPADKAALADARIALETTLTFLPDDPLATTGISVIDRIQAADAAIAATEFAKSKRLLADAYRQLGSIETKDPPVPQLQTAWQASDNRRNSGQPSPSEIYPIISVALEAIAKDPLDTDMLDTADKLLRNVLAMQSDEPTAMATVRVVGHLRTASRSLAEGAYPDARTALGEAERLFLGIGLRPAVLAPAWQALESAEQ